MENQEEPKSYSGPITVEEIKWHLASEKPPDMINRRATISDANPSRTIYADSPLQDYLIKKRFFGDDIDNMLEDNLSHSFISEYLTPNETLHNDKSVSTSNVYVAPHTSIQNSINDNIDSELNISFKKCNQVDAPQEPISCTSTTPNRSFVDTSDDKENFIEQMSKALNLSSCHSSFYASATECSNVNVHKHPNKLKLSLEKISKDNRSSQGLIQMNDTILVSSDDDDDDYYIDLSGKPCDISNDQSVFEAANGSNQDSNDSSEIYVISSDTDCSFEEQILIKTEAVESLTRLSLNQSDNVVEVVNLEAPEPSSSKAWNSKASPVGDYNKYTINSLPDHSILNVTHDNSDACEMVEQIENKSSLEESFEYGFNDTLEEMEMALKYGLDYTMPNEQPNKLLTNTSVKNCSVQHELLNTSSSQVDSSKLSIPLSNTKSNPSRKTLIPVKYSKTNGMFQKTISPIKSPLAKKDFNFKVPAKPAKTGKTPDFKNVHSPVAVYIKNSPKVPQIQHVSAKPAVAGALFSKLPRCTSSNKENEELPSRLYKPAKRAIVTKEKEIKLPASVQKYIPDTLDIVKHEVRITKNQRNPINIEKELLNDDLTICDTTDASFSNSSLSLKDISLHTTKKAFIK